MWAKHLKLSCLPNVAGKCGECFVSCFVAEWSLFGGTAVMRKPLGCHFFVQLASIKLDKIDQSLVTPKQREVCMAKHRDHTNFIGWRVSCCKFFNVKWQCNSDSFRAWMKISVLRWNSWELCWRRNLNASSSKCRAVPNSGHRNHKEKRYRQCQNLGFCKQITLTLLNLDLYLPHKLTEAR